MIETLGFIASGLLTGIFSGSLGVGGALLATPLIRFLGVTPYLAVGTTVPVLLPTTLTGTFTYGRARHLDTTVAAWTALGGVPGAVTGALTTRRVNGHVLMLLSAAILFALALRMLPRQEERAPSEPRRTPTGLITLGAVGGFFSGLLGIGGGFLFVPAFINLFALPIKTALGTSLAVIAITAVPNLIAQQAVGNIDWRVALLLFLGVIPGARIGALLSIRAPERALRFAVTVGILAVGAIYAGVELAALSSP